MICKNIDIINAINFLNKFEEVKLPTKITFAIIKNQKYFRKEYDDYNKAFIKICEPYSKYFIKDKDGHISTTKTGIPLIKDKDLSKKMTDELAELLMLETDVERYYLDDENIFNYDDSKYDVLLPKDMHILMNLLLKNEDEISIEEKKK